MRRFKWRSVAEPLPLVAGRLRLSLVATVLLGVAALAALWPARGGDLVIYSAGERAAVVAADFTRQTGIAVTVVRLFTGPLLARVSAEGHRPNWSIAWFDGDMPAAALDRAGLLAHGTVPDVRWSSLGRTLVPENGAWTPIGVTLSGVTIRIKGGTRANIAFGMSDPAMSGQAYPQIAGLLSMAGGWPRGRTLLERMRADGLSVAQTSSNVVTQVLSERIREGSIQSSTAYALATRDRTIAVEVPRPAFILPNVLVIAADTPPETRVQAERFVAYVLSEPAQKRRLEGGGVESFYWPITEGSLAPPAIMPALDTLDVVHPGATKWGTLQAEITDWFETNVARR